MGFNTPTTTQVQWSSSDTNSVAADGAFDYSDDFTFQSNTIGAMATINAKADAGPASDDQIEIYQQFKNDADADTTDEYDNQGDHIATLDCNSDDPAKKTIPLDFIQGKPCRFGAKTDGTNAITIGILITEHTWT